VLKHSRHNLQAFADHIVMGQLPMDKPQIEPEAIKQSRQIKQAALIAGGEPGLL
jgi:hypothetical protein